MRASTPLLLCLLASTARAESPEEVQRPEAAQGVEAAQGPEATPGLELTQAPLGTVALESEATHFGNSYETVYQLSLKPSATLRFGSLELSALLPLSTSATYPTYCCRVALGNATLSAAYWGRADWLHHGYELSVSAPTSRWSNAHANSLAATAALTRDAGYYLPNTTTLRAKLGAEVEVTPWLALGASAGAEYWLRHDEASNPLVVPLTTHATLTWARAWSARATYRTLARLLDPLGPQERFLHQLSGAIAHEWSGSRVEASVSVPLDESLRELDMLSLGVAYARSF
jgi:hypothetical protein